MKNLPLTIFLNFGDVPELKAVEYFEENREEYLAENDGIAPEEIDFSNLAEVTWSANRIDSTDAEYHLESWIPISEKEPYPKQLIAVRPLLDNYEIDNGRYEGMINGVGVIDKFYGPNVGFMYWYPLPELPK